MVLFDLSNEWSFFKCIEISKIFKIYRIHNSSLKNTFGSDALLTRSWNSYYHVHILYSYADLFHTNLMMEILCEDRLLKLLFCYKYFNMLQMYSLSDWNCCRNIIVTSEESHNASSITTVRYYMLHITLHMNTDNYSIMT